MPKKLALIHPGEILLEEFMKPLGVSQNRLSRDIDAPLARVNAIVHGRQGITADMALRLSRYFGTTAQFWMNLQSRYALKVAERENGPKIEKKVRPIEAA